MTAVEYIHSLERKVEELEGLLNREDSRTLEDLSTPPTPPGGQNDNQYASQLAKNLSPPDGTASREVVMHSASSSTSESDEDVIETMIGAGENDSPHPGSTERYWGSFAGLSLLQRVHNLCRHVSSNRKNHHGNTLQDDFIHAFDFASPDPNSTIPLEAFALLPPRQAFDRAIEVVMNEVCCNMQFLDRGALIIVADEVYTATEQRSRYRSRKPFALIYAVLALSRRFETAASGDMNTAQTIRGYVLHQQG